MARPIFTGAGVAIVTPFNDNGVDTKKLEELIEFQIKNKIDCIIICGSTGEAATMNHKEHVEAIKCAVDTVAGRVPVIAGTGSNDTAYGIELSQEAQKAGADAVLLVTPYYNKCTQEGLYRHYKATAESVDIPCVLYNVPSRTNVNISPELLLRLADVENIVGVKECNFGQVPDILSLCGDRYALYSGEDGLVVPMLSLGAYGVISVVANLMPEYTSTMVHSYLNGDTEKAKKMQIDVNPMVKAMFCEVNPIPVKEALNIVGMNVGPCRLPLCEMSAKNHDYVAEVLKKYDLSAITEFFG
ncbi:4-hydroxy-tetrahydrodipicolinate synthase [Ruminococcaceae bacterium YRB3002]|nr:4-hydroxy-tetrahydrodipicolinate synthase [Ruminococcaceae bacterium YRB3002]